jgi:hypothetical protein
MEGIKMDYNEWLEFGIQNGFCSLPFCETHDGIPMHETEERAWDEGGDPCHVAIRLGTPEEWALPDSWFGDN